MRDDHDVDKLHDIQWSGKELNLKQQTILRCECNVRYKLM